MIKRLLLGGLICLIAFQINAQTQFENAGFEEWEEIQYGSVDEPVNWSSIRSATPDEMAQLSPAVWGRSDDAHTGNSSLYLINKAAFGLVATGMLTSGRVKANLNYDSTNSHTVPEDSKWNMPLPHRPDSVVGWYKGKPSTNDFPTVKVLMHVGYASLPQDDSTNWVGVAYAELSGSEVSTWTRFSAPFEYFDDRTPEFALTILTSGNGTEAVDGSEAWFDDLELIYNDGTSINELSDDQLSVYASHGTLNVFVDEPGHEEGQLMVTDLSGRQVYNSTVVSGLQQQYPLSLKEGIYLVSVRFDKNTVSRKVFVK